MKSEVVGLPFFAKKIRWFQGHDQKSNSNISKLIYKTALLNFQETCKLILMTEEDLIETKKNNNFLLFFFLWSSNKQSLIRRQIIFLFSIWI